MNENTLTNLHDPFLAATSRPTDIPEHHHHAGASDDDMDDDDNGFPLDAHYLQPPSVLSEASQVEYCYLEIVNSITLYSFRYRDVEFVLFHQVYLLTWYLLQLEISS